MIKLNATTPLMFYVFESTYVPGEGYATAWNKFVSDGYETFWADWKGGFGDRAIAAQAQGVGDMATVRTFYIPTLYEKLRTKRTIVIKNADATAIKDDIPDKNNPNCYELWGGVDNIGEVNQLMEFRVKRVEQI